MEYTNVMPFPKRVMLEVTNYCNNKCIFCGSQCSKRRYGKIDKVFAVDVLEKLYCKGVREVGFHGMGEPLLYEGLAELVFAAKEIGYTYTYMDTNGILAVPERIGPVIDAGLDSVKFSIHAASRETYFKVNRTDNFDVVKGNLIALSCYKEKHNMDFRLITFFAENIYNTQEKQQFEDEMSKYSEVWISTIHNASGTRTEENKKIAVTKDIRAWKGQICKEPFQRIIIAWNGDVMACCTDWTGSLIYGNAAANDLDALWNNKKMQEIRANILMGGGRNIICKKCMGCEGE